MSKLRLFAWVRVVSATGKSRRRRVNVRKAQSPEELATKFASSVTRFVTDPTIKGFTIDVRTHPDLSDPEQRADYRDAEDAGEGDFMWNHEPTLSKQVVALLEKTFPSLTITASPVSDL